MPADDTFRELMAEVPASYAERFADLVRLTAAFCNAHLNAEYRQLCREMAVVVCQERCPVLKGRTEGWAAGIVCALGRVNFLDDPSQTPHMKSRETAAGFGISVATMQAKAKVIRKGLDLVPFRPDWSLPSRMDDSPLVWMLRVNGFLVDTRWAPREAQVVAYEQGLIPHIPADRKTAAGTTTVSRRRALPERAPHRTGPRGTRCSGAGRDEAPSGFTATVCEGCPHSVPVQRASRVRTGL